MLLLKIKFYHISHLRHKPLHLGSQIRVLAGQLGHQTLHSLHERRVAHVISQHAHGF